MQLCSYRCHRILRFVEAAEVASYAPAWRQCQLLSVACTGQDLHAFNNFEQALKLSSLKVLFSSQTTTLCIPLLLQCST